MSRFSALTTGDDQAEVWDEETGDTCHVTFHGPNAHEMADACARTWNAMLDNMIASIPDTLPEGW